MFLFSFVVAPSAGTRHLNAKKTNKQKTKQNKNKTKQKKQTKTASNNKQTNKNSRKGWQRFNRKFGRRQKVRTECSSLAHSEKMSKKIDPEDSAPRGLGPGSSDIEAVTSSGVTMFETGKGSWVGGGEGESGFGGAWEGGGGGVSIEVKDLNAVINMKEWVRD